MHIEAINQCNWDECFNEDNIYAATEMWTSKMLYIAKSSILNKIVPIIPNDKAIA